MVATPLTVVALPSGYSDHPVVTPFVAGDNVAGNSFISSGREILKALNSAAETDEVITLSASGALTSGSYTLILVIGGTTFTTAAINFDATAAQIAAAVLAATGGGTTLAVAYPQGTVVGSGGPLTTPTDVLLTFAGIGHPVSANGTAVSGVAGTGTTGFGGVSFPAPTAGGAGVAGGTLTITRSTNGAGVTHYTVTSTPDTPEQRTRDEGPIAVAPGQYVETQMFPQLGWQAGGKIALTCDSASMKFAVVSVPLF